MPSSVLPFLMFQGEAAEALDFYAQVFPALTVDEVDQYAGADGSAGTGKLTRISLHGQQVIVFDSPMKHAFGFTPAFSFFVSCDSEEEVKRLARTLSEGGAEMMPPDDYGFSTLFAWVSDRFGVSWQLNFVAAAAD